MAMLIKALPTSQTELFTKDLGWETNAMVLASRSGPMVLAMRGVGKMARPMDAVN